MVAEAVTAPMVALPVGIRLSVDPARRLSCELPQGRKAARVNGLCRVRGVPSLTPPTVFDSERAPRCSTAKGPHGVFRFPQPCGALGSAHTPPAGLCRAAGQEAGLGSDPRQT